MNNFKQLKQMSPLESEYRRTIFMTPKEFSKEYCIGITKVYQLTNIKNFPMIKNGNRILIIRSKVENWIETNIGLEF